MKKKKPKKRTRDGKAIKMWLISQDITQADIVRAIGVNGGGVSRTINGKRNIRKVLRYLEERGIDKGLLWMEKGKFSITSMVSAHNEGMKVRASHR